MGDGRRPPRSDPNALSRTRRVVRRELMRLLSDAMLRAGLSSERAAAAASFERIWWRWIAAVDGRRIDVGMTLVADHLYVDVSGRTIDGPLHRGAH